MTSFIISGRDKAKRIGFAKDFCTKEEINPIDIALIEKDTTLKQNVNSIGIDEVKRIQQSVFLKPLKSKRKAVIVEDAHLLTTEAQNAFLKVLEEPPNHTLLLLGADSKEAFLPTILSRCQVIELESELPTLTTREQNAINQFIEELHTMTIGEKLKKAESLAKDKDKAIEWLEKVIVVMRKQLITTVILVNEAHPESLSAETLRDSGQARMTMTLRQLQKVHALLRSTNVNPRFAIENTLLNISTS